jgi:hypothetical protein
MLTPSEMTCRAIYDLTVPGQYRVIVEYEAPPPDSVVAAVLRRDLETYRRLFPWTSLRLADTATFVVVPR